MADPVSERTLDPLDFQGVLMAVQCGDVSTGWARDALRSWLAGKPLPALPENDEPNPFGMNDNPAEVCNRLLAAGDALAAAAAKAGPLIPARVDLPPHRAALGEAVNAWRAIRG